MATESTKKEKVVFVVGASTGIGEDTAIQFHRAGYHVVASVRAEADFLKLRSILGNRGTVVKLDVTNASSVEAAFESLRDLFSQHGLDVLVNNAGIAVGGPLEFLKLEEIRHQFEVNVFGILRVTQLALPWLRLAKGKIINVSSESGYVSFPFLGPYSASKFALEAFSDALRLEIIEQEIHVVLIEPGPIKTPIWERSIAAAIGIRKNMPPVAESLYGAQLDAFLQFVKNSAAHSVPVSQVSSKILEAAQSKKPRIRYRVGTSALVNFAIAHFVPARTADLLKLKILKG